MRDVSYFFLIGWAISQVGELIRLGVKQFLKLSYFVSCPLYRFIVIFLSNMENTKYAFHFSKVYYFTLDTCKKEIRRGIQLESEDWQRLQLYMLHFTSLCFGVWISWIICWIVQRKLLYGTEQREHQRPAAFRIYCNSRWWDKWKVTGKITSKIPSNSPYKVQLKLISSQRPQKLGSVISFTFIFSCYL